MPRTKPSQARSKILKAEQIRLQQLKHNPEFQRDLAELEAVAKRLPSGPSSRILIRDNQNPEFKFDSKDFEAVTKRSTTPDEDAFHELAQRFKEKWDFEPLWGDDGRVQLLTVSPVSFTPSAQREIVEVTRSYKHHSRGLVDALEKYDLQLWDETHLRQGRKVSRRRKRPDTAVLKLKSRKLATEGKTHQQIAKALFPREYRDTLKRDRKHDKKSRELLGDLIAKYRTPPYDMTEPEAERKAAAELGLDMRPPSVKLHKLTERVRYLLKSSPLQK